MPGQLIMTLNLLDFFFVTNILQILWEKQSLCHLHGSKNNLVI